MIEYEFMILYSLIVLLKKKIKTSNRIQQATNVNYFIIQQ